MSETEAAVTDEQLRVEGWPAGHFDLGIVGTTVQRAEEVPCQPPSFPRRAHPGSRQIVRACVRSAARERYHCVTLSDLSDSAGVSERRVRRAFSECLDISPTAYLRTAALLEVRRTLLEPTSPRDAVTRTATEVGFWHLSQQCSANRPAIRSLGHGQTGTTTAGEAFGFSHG